MRSRAVIAPGATDVRSGSVVLGLAGSRIVVPSRRVKATIRGPLGFFAGDNVRASSVGEAVGLSPEVAAFDATLWDEGVGKGADAGAASDGASEDGASSVTGIRDADGGSVVSSTVTTSDSGGRWTGAVGEESL